MFRRMGRAIRRAVLGPSPVPYADVEISFSAGVLDGEGLFLLRPAWLLDPYFALEGFAGLSPRAGRRTSSWPAWAGPCAWSPGAAIGPYLNAGVGAAHLRPKADNFVAGDGDADGARRRRRLRDHVQEADHGAPRLAQLDDVRPGPGLQRPGVLSGGLAIFF